MLHRKKKLSEQVVVITGASSGIGLVTAKRAAARGAAVVLAARNERDLERALREIEASGGRAIAVPTDVSDPRAVDALAARALAAFGRIDTWVNNAAVSMYGRIEDVALVDARRQFDVIFWGYVHGSLSAMRAMHGHEGGIINVTSALADRAIPLQGYYCAAKHAIKAFTDTLRMELEQAGHPIAITQIKPGSTDTPFFEKAHNSFDHEAQPVPPVYAPELVADVILACCERPRRDVVVSGMGKLLSMSNHISPRLADLYLGRRGAETAQLTKIPKRADRPDNLWLAVEDDGGERGRTWQGRTKETSAYTWAAMHAAPLALSILGGLVGATAMALGARALGRHHPFGMQR